jgi:transaldolase
MNTKIFLDSGDPAETRHTLATLGFLDGQTTNPSLVAKNPHIQELKSQGLLNEESIWEKYRNVALEIHETIPNGAISVEVYADAETTADMMLAKARELASWFPGVYVKLPITTVGLKVAEQLVAEGVNVNMTLCFSQEQAAAVHAATRGARPGQVFVSPFIGRLDDIGQQGVHLVKNIALMYQQWNSHVRVLAASIRGLEHLFAAMKAGADIVTIPVMVADLWATYGVDKDISHYPLEISEKAPIQYKELPEQDWMIYDIEHPLTQKGIEKFASDWKSLFM